MDSETKVILIGDGEFTNCKSMTSLRQLIKEGKAILITDAIIDEMFLDTKTLLQEFGKAMSTFSAEVQISKESMEALIETFKINNERKYDFFYELPILIKHNYRKPNLRYTHLRDKRKYRASVNRR